jgi:transposase, IS30 family
MPGSRLSLQDRVEIQCGIASGLSDRQIGVVISKDRTTVLREVRAAGGRQTYCAENGQQRSLRAAKRPKVLRLADPGLQAEVVEGLSKRWSPASIAMATGRICAETIYQAIYMGGKGPLPVESCRRLVSKRRQRRTRKPKESLRRNVLGPVRSIATRPIAAECRLPGNWEGDLIVGSKNRSAVVTLACRASRFTLLADLPDGHTAPEVTAALVELFDRIPPHLRRTLTWDQGREMAAWENTEALIDGLKIFFCDPHSPWQRPTNEQTNGMLRRWMPKGIDLNVYTRADLNRIETNINTMPRRLHSGKSAQYLFDIYSLSR